MVATMTFLRNLFLIVFVLASGVSVCAQTWVRIDSQQIVEHYNGLHETGKPMVKDRCGNRIIGAFNGRAWESLDTGRTWYEMVVPPIKPRMYDPRLHADSCTIVMTWEDADAENLVRCAVLEEDGWHDRTPSFAYAHWTIGPRHRSYADRDGIIMAMNDLDDRFFVSTDRGRTWDSIIVGAGATSEFNSNVNYWSRMGPGRIARISKLGLFELNVFTKTLTFLTRHDSAAYVVRDASENLLAAFRRTSDNMMLRRSTDNGTTWQPIDTLHFDNAPPLPLPNFYVRRWHTSRDGELILALHALNIIVGTRDAGRTWHLIGELQRSAWSNSPRSNYEDTDDDGRLYFFTPDQICRIDSWQDTLRTMTMYPGYGQSLVVLDSTSCVYKTSRSVVSKSTSRDTLWRAATFIENDTVLRTGVDPLRQIPFTIIKAGPNSQVYSYLANAGMRLTTYHNDEAERSRVNLLSAISFEESEYQPWWLSRGALQGVYFGEVTFTGKNQFLPGLNYLYISLKSFDEKYVAWLAADSLWRSDDTGRTWTRVGDGLPRVDNGAGLLAISRVTRVSDNIVLAGARGIRTLEGIDTVDFAPGGIWMSTDNGVSWSRRDTGLGSRSYVWWIASVDDSVVLATVGEITYSNFGNEPNYTMSNAAIVRSNDTGRTWTVVFDEGRTRPAYTGQRKILVVDTSRILVTSIEDGVLESRDKGRTWQTIGGDVFTFQYVSDIDVDEEGGVYAGAWNGLYYLPPTSTSVIDEPRDHQRFTNVWARPVPTSSALIVRINNLDLLRGASSPTLHLYDMVGNAVADLTSELRGAGSTRQFEFTYDMASLDNGIYLLVLDTGKEKTVMKVMKVG